MAEEDYYELLGVSRQATAQDIKKAYRKLAVQYHPDKNPGDEKAEERFKAISEAYEILSDSNKRAAFDRYGRAAFDQNPSGNRGHGGFQDPADLFREIFNSQESGVFGSFFRNNANKAQYGEDLHYDLSITLHEAFSGVEKQVLYARKTLCKSCSGNGTAKGGKAKPCPACHGQGYTTSGGGFFHMQQTCRQCGGEGSFIDNPCGKCGGEGLKSERKKVKIKIPSGVDTGLQLRLDAHGSESPKGGSPGDLYITIHVEPHAFFRRDGQDIFCVVPIAFTLATLGGKIEIETLSDLAKLKIPAGTQSGTIFRLRGKGMPDLRRHGHGDQHVRVEVEVPKKLNHKQRKILEQFSHACKEGQTESSSRSRR